GLRAVRHEGRCATPAGCPGGLPVQVVDDFKTPHRCLLSVPARLSPRPVPVRLTASLPHRGRVARAFGDGHAPPPLRPPGGQGEGVTGRPRPSASGNGRITPAEKAESDGGGPTGRAKKTKKSAPALSLGAVAAGVRNRRQGGGPPPRPNNAFAGRQVR